MKKIWQTLFILAVAGLACHANAADNGATSQYSGTVVDEKGQAVEGATVDCYQYPSSSGWFGYRDREPELQQTTLTDSHGAFAVSASQNTTLVVVKKPGLATAWKTFGNAIPDSTDPIVLTAPATLSGVVVDDNDQPVAGAEVWVAGANIGNEYDSASQMNELFGRPARSCFSARTGADGRFRIENFPADGRAGLALNKAGMARHPVGGEFAGERDCQPGGDIKLVVGPAGSVEGKVVVTETGLPLGGVKINLDSAGPGVYDSTYGEAVESRADGTFHIPDVQPGKHFIRASIAGGQVPDWVLVPEDSQVTVVAGETARNVVIHYSKGALVEVTVVVTNELTPIANALVSAGGSTAYTDMNGKVLLRVPAGTNWFFARKDWLSQNKTAGVEAGQTNYVQIELTPPPRISGTVRDSLGAPAAGVFVSFHPGHYPDAPDYAEVMTDENGRYEMKLKLSRETEGWAGAITTTSFVMARDLKRNLAAIQEFGTSPTHFDFMGMVTIPTNLDLTLQPGITLTGSVKDSDGNPVTNALLDLSIESGNSSLSFKPQPTQVDAQGLFNYPAMPQGRAYYFWETHAKGYGTAYGFLKPEDSKTNHYEFPTFVLKRADLKLAGQILDRDGKPVVGARVNMSGQGQLMFRETKSDGQGYFIFNGVCAGEVKVNARYSTGTDSSNSEEGDASAQGGDTNVVVRLGIYVGNNKYLSPPLKTTGIVCDPFGTPVAGATVRLFPTQVRDITVQTDNNGRYELNWQARLVNDETHWVLASDAKRNLTALLPVDQKMTNLDLNLEDGLPLSAKVSDTEGHAITTATATVTLWEGNRGYGINPQPVTADNSGHLRIVGLPQGQKYWVQIGATNHTSATLRTEADETRTNLLELPPVVLTPTDGEVSGRVLDAEGKAAAGIEVQMFSSGMPTPRTTTDDNGHFEYHGVRRGALSFMAGLPIANSSALSNSGSARGKSGDTNVVIRLGTDRRSPLASNVTITTSGTVFDPSGRPAPGVLLAMLPSGGLGYPVQSDAEGKYTLQWQTLFISANSSTKPMILARDPAHNLAATGEIDTNTTSLDLRLQPGLTFFGDVEDSNGRQVTNAVVQLVPYPLDDKRATLNQMPPTNASPEGLYFFSALPQGAPCRVNVSAAGYGSGNVTVLATDTKTTQFRLPAVILNFANQQVAGQVIGQDGKPCWGAEVTVNGDGQPAGRITHSDSNGHFVITKVCTGLLNVRADLPASPVVTVQAHGGDTNVVVKLGH